MQVTCVNCFDIRKEATPHAWKFSYVFGKPKTNVNGSICKDCAKSLKAKPLKK